MAFFNWNDRLSVNVESIDRQHRVLIGFINTLADHIINKKSGILIDSATNQLISYSKIHFSYEEMLFDIHNYPDNVEHLKLHDKLFVAIDAHIEKLKNKEIEADVVLDFLKKWLEIHIMNEDIQYSEYMTEKEVK